MGVAAYNRGTALIQRQTDRALGIPDRLPPQPTARAEGWGDKARLRAEARALRIVIIGAKAGLARLDVVSLAELVVEREHVGIATAQAAAEKALTDTA